VRLGQRLKHPGVPHGIGLREGEIVPKFADFDSRLFLEQWRPIHPYHRRHRFHCFVNQAIPQTQQARQRRAFH
jgi:hypothetical protein